ncbi:MAG: CDP-diacylglycerol--glycerol-3-phosphate 3-phosphatidyltransferase [Bacteroidota bacterium]
MSLPNSLTIFRIILTPVFLLLLFSNSSFDKQLSLFVFFIAALTDWYDGWIARKYGVMTRTGKFLDPLADKILTIATLFGFVYLNLIEAWMVWVVVVRDVIITGLRMYAEYKDQPIITSKTAQAKTFGEFIIIYYILIFYVGGTVPIIRKNWGALIDSLTETRVLFGMMLVVVISAVGTGVMYLFDNRKFIRDLYAGNIDAR